ncbi:MAG: DUF1016 family protein [Candidatus Latescibacteria bacterium]|nr:DUF1016 family protein [Candidatus Latescibacterota bacterium]
MENGIQTRFYQSVKKILNDARDNAYRAVNFAMVEAYWHIGRLIVEEEQKGGKRADYGKSLINELSARLTEEFGKGFSPQSLWNIRLFYINFPILSALRRELSWTHYKWLIRIENQEARLWYMNEAATCNWSTRALERQIHSLYYERLLSSKDKQAVIEEATTKTDRLKPRPEDYLKDPYILEFLNLRDRSSFRESELEQALIDKLQDFLLELGKGFAFVARQKRIFTETKEFYIQPLAKVQKMWKHHTASNGKTALLLSL